MSCKSCNIVFVNTDVVAKCTECKLEFHPACTSAGSQNFTKSRNKTWRCDNCAEKTAKEPEDAVSEDRKWLLSALSSMENKIISNFNTKIDSVHNSVQRLSEDFKTLSVKVGSLENTQTELKEQCDQLQQDCAERDREVRELKMQLRDMEQHSRCANIEIVGVPSTKNESILAVLRSIAVALDVTFIQQHISAAHRLRLFSAQRHEHPPIIVQFVSRSTKEEWLAAARTKKKLSAVEVSPGFPDRPVYVNHHLTPYNKELLGRARRLYREKKIHFAAFSNGKVLIKAKEGDATIRVLETKDLDCYDK